MKPLRQIFVGTRVKVKPAAAHDKETSGKEGTIRKIGGRALGIKFDKMNNKIHRWYTSDELEIIDKKLKENKKCSRKHYKKSYRPRRQISGHE